MLFDVMVNANINDFPCKCITQAMSFKFLTGDRSMPKLISTFKIMSKLVSPAINSLTLSEKWCFYQRKCLLATSRRGLKMHVNPHNTQTGLSFLDIGIFRIFV